MPRHLGKIWKAGEARRPKQPEEGGARAGPSARKVPNGSFKTLERYMIRQHGILGRLE